MQSRARLSTGRPRKASQRRRPFSEDLKMGGSQPRRFLDEMCQEEGIAEGKALSSEGPPVFGSSEEAEMRVVLGPLR